MSSPLDDALRELSHELADSRSIGQAALDSDGRLLLRANHYRGETWLRLEEGRLVEVDPSADGLLPLAATLSSAHAARVEVLAYRPGRRLVLRERRPTGIVVHKGYRVRRWSEAEARHRIASAATAGSGGFLAPRVIAAEPETASVCLEYLDGRPVALTEAGADGFFAIGVALRALQESGAGQELEPFSALDEVEVVSRWAERSRELAGWVPDRWRERLRELESAAVRLPAAEVGLAHRDLHDRQLIDTESGVGLLDFDLMCRADPALDPANLLAHLTLRSLQGGATESASNACGRALIEGLERGDEPGWWPRLRFYQATSFYRLAFVYRLRPRWSGLPELLLEYGSRCFEEVIDP